MFHTLFFDAGRVVFFGENNDAATAYFRESFPEVGLQSIIFGPLLAGCLTPNVIGRQPEAISCVGKFSGFCLTLHALTSTAKTCPQRRMLANSGLSVFQLIRQVPSCSRASNILTANGPIPHMLG